MPVFFKDFVVSFIVLGAGFVLPYFVVLYWWGGSEELALLVGWLVCSGVTAWLMGEGGSDE